MTFSLFPAVSTLRVLTHKGLQSPQSQPSQEILARGLAATRTSSFQRSTTAQESGHMTISPIGRFLFNGNCLTAWPPGSFDLGVGNSFEFGNALDGGRATVLAVISTQENDGPLSSDSMAADALQDFCGSVTPPAMGGPAPLGTHMTVTSTVPLYCPARTFLGESPELKSDAIVLCHDSVARLDGRPILAVDSISGVRALPLPDAANATGRRVGGSWKVPLTVSRLASQIPSCASSPKQAIAQRSSLPQPPIIIVFQ
ncbi:hypothetical protein H4582DRAFT_2129368 [Lactarius indigo]|nr:hypothetical protein H4582DRAFT_2129368 [Lactarius indigo]